MKLLFYAGIFFVMLITWSACKDPFDPHIPGAKKGFLVVEGYINIGDSVITTIQLSRTGNVTEKLQHTPEAGAMIFIRNEEGDKFVLYEKGDGRYASDKLSLPISQQYGLEILTSDGKQYHSEFEQPIVTPAIDSVSWRRIDEGVAIFVSTHDPARQTLNYQWDYEEIWEVNSAFGTAFGYSGGELTIRAESEYRQMYTCWKYEYPERLIMATTSALQHDVISMKQLILIPSHDEKLAVKYSVLVRQHTLSRSNYEYLQVMERNTTDVGSFSDPQPSELFGNIYGETEDEPVVGFVGVYTTSEIRILIRSREVPNWHFDMQCREIAVTNVPDSLSKYLDGLGYVPTKSDGTFPPSTILAATIACVDCRTRGGNNNRPDFWD